MHNVSKVLLGVPLSSVRRASTYDSDPATFEAGLAVRQSTTPNVLSLTSGFKIGISLGKSLSDHKKTSVCMDGRRVPLLASLQRASGIITVSSYANLLTTTPDVVTIGGQAFTAQSGAATLGQPVFRAATDNASTAISLAAQINAHTATAAKVYAVVTSSGVVTVYSVVDGVGSTGTGNDIGLTYTDNGGGNIGITLSGLSSNKLSGGSDTISDVTYQVVGQKVYINDFTGKADMALTGYTTVSDATYALGGIELTGIKEDGTETSACLVDMPGGL